MKKSLGKKKVRSKSELKRLKIQRRLKDVAETSYFERMQTETPREKYRRIEKSQGAVLCRACGWLGTSWHRHDFVTCGCLNWTHIDGGRDYTKIGATDLKLVQLLNLVPLKKPKRKKGSDQAELDFGPEAA